MDRNVGFIGTGNMGTAMLRSLVESGLVDASRLYIFDVDREKTGKIRKETGVNVTAGSGEAVDKSDIVILAVKPNAIKQALESCKKNFDASKILVSIAVGVPIKFYKEILGSDRKVIRAMPNTPALVREGMTLVSPDDLVGAEELQAVKKLFKCLGRVEELEEKLMSEVTALTGSSPAYVHMFIEAMADAAVLSGIPREMAYRLAAQAVLGSAKMVLDTGKHPGELKDQVCSPGGTTIEAVYALEKNGFRHAVMEAMNECTKKAREIGKQFEK